MKYMYSWSLHNQEGYRQKINENDEVIDVRSISLSEAQQKYAQFPDGEDIY